ncbi:Uncharacterized protein APZ42_020529 [Daphnia magna]|uniref:Uncharacterized protein n=1 Tax=Daphnia magna TaxID=35525 RepID=A0A164X615_9CRUS|nr:Uncharacterized protein APZ42_020529 [Daphnia magna]
MIIKNKVPIFMWKTKNEKTKTKKKTIAVECVVRYASLDVSRPYTLLCMKLGRSMGRHQTH